MAGLIIILLIVLLITISLLMGVVGVPYVPTPKRVISKIKEQNLIQDGDKILELGSGDARVIRRIYKDYDIDAKGYEISPLFFIISWILSNIENYRLKSKRKNQISILYKSYYSADFENADIIYCYLLPNTLKRLFPMFEKMKKGSRIISYDFKIQAFKEYQTIDIDKNKKIYIYDIK